MSSEREFVPARPVGAHVFKDGELTVYGLAMLYVPRDPAMIAAHKFILTVGMVTVPGLNPLPHGEAVARIVREREAVWETERVGPLANWELAHTTLSFMLMGPELPT